jgi:hypothetical protein
MWAPNCACVGGAAVVDGTSAVEPLLPGFAHTANIAGTAPFRQSSNDYVQT